VSLRLVSYNIRFGGLGRRTAIRDVLGALDPDLVVLQEATDPATVEWIADALDFATVAAERSRSVAAIARRPIRDVRWHHSRPGRSFLELRLPDQRLRVFAVHLSSGLSRRGERRRQLEAAALLTAAAEPGPAADTLIVGDLNAVAPGDGLSVRRLPTWIRILLRFDGGIRTEVMTELLGAGYVDAFRVLHPTDPGETMPSVDPSVRLDYLLMSSGAMQRVSQCAPAELDRTLLVRASDHLPLTATLDD